MMESLILALAVQDNPFAVGGNIAQLSPAEWRLIYRDYGDCVISRFRKQAVAAIVDNVDDETLMKRRSPLPAPSCLKPPRMMSVMFGLQADRVRYAIADALVRSELGELPAPDLRATPPLKHPSAGDPPSDASGKPDEEEVRVYRERYAFAQFSRFGECVVRTDPAAARNLLLTLHESKEESTAFGKVGPALANCLVAGETMAMTKLPLRGTIAINYYRLAHAARQPAER